MHGSSLSKVLDALGYGAGGAVTKSIDQEQREGYAERTLVEVEGGMVNAASLPNPGAEQFSHELEGIGGKGPPIFVSIFGGDGREFGSVTETVRKFAVFNDVNLGTIAYLERKGIRSLDRSAGAAHRTGGLKAVSLGGSA